MVAVPGLIWANILGLLLLSIGGNANIVSADETSDVLVDQSSASNPPISTTTSTSKSVIRLTSQSISSKTDSKDPKIESSVLNEKPVPTNLVTESITSILQTVSVSPLSSKQVPATSEPSTIEPILKSSFSFIPTDHVSAESNPTSEPTSASNIITEVSSETEVMASSEFSDVSDNNIIEPKSIVDKTTESTVTTSTSSQLEFFSDIDPSFPSSSSSSSSSSTQRASEASPTAPTDVKFNNSNFTHSNISLENLDDLSEDTQFLSFEEWKKRKGADSNSAQKEPEIYSNRMPKAPSAKDSIGEEMEIDISNFFEQPEPEGKLYKDKFNFASFDCAATIVKTNSEAKGATSILFENKDSYLLNPCSAPNKFVIVELCQDILVDSFIMGNFEFFSSTFKKIQISVSETFPVPLNGWKILGQFDARDVRDFQTFQIENPMIWAKYFRIEILEHYGSEFYCPLSVVRVHGRTMMQEYKQEEALQISKTKELESESEKSKQAAMEFEDAITKDSEFDNELKPIGSKTVDCVLTNQTVNNSIKNIQKNLTNIAEFDVNDECYVSLPQLRFDDIFNDYQTDESKCDSMEYNNTLSNQKNKTAQIITTHASTSSTGTQESIYKNIMKRLSLLESNATLSVLYIEEQSKLLSNAFSSLEKKQSLKFDKLIDTFNTSIYSQLENLSTLYSLFQKQTDELLTNQRLKHEHLLYDANLKIDILTSDLKFQKILSFINGLILICILVYVVITRDTYIEEYNNSADQNAKYRAMSISKSRIASTGSRLRANFRRRIYNTSDGNIEYDSSKSLGPSDEEIDDGRTTPSSNEKQESIQRPESANTVVNRPPTPDNSDHE